MVIRIQRQYGWKCSFPYFCQPKIMKFGRKLSEIHISKRKWKILKTKPKFLSDGPVLTKSTVLSGFQWRSVMKQKACFPSKGSISDVQYALLLQKSPKQVPSSIQEEGQVGAYPNRLCAISKAFAKAASEWWAKFAGTRNEAEISGLGGAQTMLLW